MSTVQGNYSAPSYYNSLTESTRKKEEQEKSRQTDTAGKAADITKTNQTKLSNKAEALLKRLRKTYQNMDFMVADKDMDKKSFSVSGTKEFSVLFSAEELEKMASSEKNEKEYMDRIQGAVRMSRRISEQFGQESGKGELTKVGISFEADGTVTYFAELQKSSEKQKERISKNQEKRLAEKREEAGEQKKAADTKKTVVQASSEKELLEKISKIDWSRIKEDEMIQTQGIVVDYSV